MASEPNPVMRLQELLERIRGPALMASPRDIAAPAARVLAPLQLLEKASRPLASPMPSDRWREFAERIRAEESAHEDELARAWRGEDVADPMPSELPRTLADELALERREHCFRVARFVRSESDRPRWLRWLSRREAAVLLRMAELRAGVDDDDDDELAARVARALAWSDPVARDRAIRMALYELLHGFRSNGTDEDVARVALLWRREAPELARVDVLAVFDDGAEGVESVSLASVVRAWGRAESGGRNRRPLARVLMDFFECVLGQVKSENTIRDELREFRQTRSMRGEAMERQ
jgi:hypothetical protein